MSSLKPPPRFVPTLTEVVRPGVVPPVTAVIDPEHLTEQVLQAIKPRLEQQLRASLHAWVEEHMRRVAPQLQQDMEAAVKEAVTQATASQAAPEN